MFDNFSPGARNLSKGKATLDPTLQGKPQIPTSHKRQQSVSQPKKKVNLNPKNIDQEHPSQLQKLRLCQHHQTII